MLFAKVMAWARPQFAGFDSLVGERPVGQRDGIAFVTCRPWLHTRE
jgi:hypothetical protein